MPMGSRRFPPVSSCALTGREKHAVAADLDGTLLVSRSSFPYFMLVAIEAGGYLRGIALLLLSPLVLFLYRLVSESAGIQLLIFVSLAGLPMSSIERVSSTVLPGFYAEDVREESWRAFRACGRRRVVVTANPTVMVEPFVRECLGGDAVLGTELVVWRGRATGLVGREGVMVGKRKGEAVARAFAGEGMPELGLGDRDSDHDFMALCKEGYMVPPDRSAVKAVLDGSTIRGSHLALRPTPRAALLTFLWLPIAFSLSLLRLTLSRLLPSRQPLLLRLATRGRAPRRASLLVCNHRTQIDAVILSVALRRPVLHATYAPPSASDFLLPVRYVRLNGDPATDAKVIQRLLAEGKDVAVFPEGEACKEECLLRFDPAFAGLGEKVVPVGVRTGEGMFRGGGWEWMMNPRPECEVVFLEEVERQGREAAEVAAEVERSVGECLGFRRSGMTAAEMRAKFAGGREA